MIMRASFAPGTMFFGCGFRGVTPNGFDCATTTGLLTSTDTPGATLVGGGTALISGLTLEELPGQSFGGGAERECFSRNDQFGIAPRARRLINVQFLLGVEQGGTFRLFLNIEALPGGAAAPEEAKVLPVKNAKK